jgi:predicted small secreted protein
MKRKMGLVLMLVLSIGIMAGCNGVGLKTTEGSADNIRLTATIDAVSNTELLVTVLDNTDFNQARVNMQGFDSLDFVPRIGQTIKLEIKKQVDKSMPPYVNPVKIELVK